MIKKYITPGMRMIDLVEEGMIATSLSSDELNLSDEEVGEEFTNGKNFWDREGIWK